MFGGRRGAVLVIAGALLSTAPAHSAGKPRRNQGANAHASQTTLTAIRLVGDATAPAVELAADGALPEPVVGVLEGPPRIYLDLSDVRSGAAVPAAGLGVVNRVRVAIHSLSPLVTRVVIDLTERRAHRLDVSQRRAGLIRISIGMAETGRAGASPHGASRSDATAERARVPDRKAGRASEGTSPTSAAPRQATPAPDALPAPGAQYRARVAPIVEQLKTVLPVLESIDQRKAVRREDLDAAAQTLTAVHDELEAMQPTRDGAVVHDTLRSVCTLATTAVSLTRTASGQEVPWNASSAAAGAQLLLDRARTALLDR